MEKRRNYLKDLGRRISVSGNTLTGNLLFELRMIVDHEGGIEEGINDAIDMRESEERDRTYYLS